MCIHMHSILLETDAAVMGPLQVVEMVVVITPCGIDAFIEVEKQAAFGSVFSPKDLMKKQITPL